MDALNGLMARYGVKTFNGPLKVPHLGELGMIEPQLASDLYTRIFQTLPSDDYANFMNEFPTIELETENKFYHWRLAGNNNKNISLLDWSAPDGSQPSVVGQNGQYWYMYFAEAFFNENDVIVGENPDDYYIQIVARETESANRYKYTVRLITDDPINKLVPTTEFATGTRWSKETNFQSGERSYKGTEAHFTTFVELKARAALQRMQYKIDGNIIAEGRNTPLVFGFPDPTDPKNTKAYTKAFVNFYDMVALYQFRKQQARAFLFSHKNYDQNEVYYNMDGQNGCTIGTFAGMFNQIAHTNIHPYSTLNLDKIVDMTIEMGLAYKMADQYYVTIETGAYGLQDISRWIEDRSTQYTPNFVTERVKTNGDMGGQGLTYQGVYTQFKSYNGVNIRVKPRPFFDDPERYKTKHFSGYGLNSSRHMLIRGGQAPNGEWLGDPGIYKLKVKGFGNGIFKYIPGMRDPFSFGGTALNASAMTTSSIDGYEVHGMDYTGCVVKDPTKLVWMPYSA